MKIGYTQTDYPVKRNILNIVNDAEYVLLKKNNNLFHSISTIKKILTRKKLNFEGKYYLWNANEIDILHLFNDINYSNKKWISTFETLVPRFAETKDDHQKTEPSHIKNKKTEIAFRKIHKKNCLGIIALSANSINIQNELLKHYPKYQDSVKKKLFLIPPPQQVINHTKNFETTKILTFIFVGSQFHRKGGAEMFEVLKKLKISYNFKLIVISSFKTDTYVTNVSLDEAQKTKKSLESQDWIEIYDEIPNDKVLELVNESHIGLLPTWSDTYGFSVLEMQAAGVPVVTTDIRALPEINNNKCGWLIHLPQNRLKQALYFSEEQKEGLRETLKKQLEDILVSIFDNKDILKEKSKAAIERIKEEHNPEKVKEKLLKIYNQ